VVHANLPGQECWGEKAAARMKCLGELISRVCSCQNTVGIVARATQHSKLQGMSTFWNSNTD